MDIAGEYCFNRGVTVRNINASKSYYLGTRVKDDLGDQVLSSSGAMPPTAVGTDDTAEAWADRVEVDMPRGQRAWTTGTGRAKIHRRNCITVCAQPDCGPGTSNSY